MPAGRFDTAVKLSRAQRSGRVVRQRYRGGATFDLELSDHVQGVAFFARQWEPQVVRYITRHLPATGTFLDVGANVGLISFQIAHARPKARIEAFEAHPAVADRWAHNQSLNNATNATLHQAAVSNRIGTTAFVDERETGFGRVDADRAEPLPHIEVPATTLDQFCAAEGIERIDVLKIDIEGHEPQALEGAQRLLATGAIKAIVSEVHNEMRGALSAILEPHGFRYEDVPAVGVRRLRRGAISIDGAFVLH